MTSEQGTQVTQAGMRSLGEKLRTFRNTLTPEEQAALSMMIERARAHQGDVQGFWWSDEGGSQQEWWWDSAERWW